MDVDPLNSKIFKKICKSAGRAVADYRMIAAGDRLLVGLSGGKDSMTLMHVLTHLQRHARLILNLPPSLSTPDSLDSTPLRFKNTRWNRDGLTIS